MIVNQWVPAAHKGDAIGDTARRVRGLLREMGHESDIYAMTIDDDLRGDVIPWTDAGAHARRPDDLSLRAGLADDRGVRAAARRGRVLQYHNVTPAHFFAGYDAGDLPAGDARARGAEDAGRPYRRRARRFRIQPAGARGARLHQHRRVSDRRRYRAHHATRRGGRRSSRCSTRGLAQLPVRRPHRPEQEDRGSHQARRALQALRRRAVPLHLRRQDRRRRRATTTPIRALLERYRMPQGRFIFTGPVPDEDLATYYRTASVYISLSEHEGFCVPLLEAMAADVPVLPTRRRRCRTRWAARACSSRRRISNTRPSCSASSPTTTSLRSAGHCRPARRLADFRRRSHPQGALKG